MKVTFAVFADYVNLSQEGKLNILGIFNVVFVESLPGGVLNSHVVVRFQAEAEEKGQSKTVQLRFLDPDGGEIFKETNVVRIPNDGPPGPVILDLDTVVQVLPFPKYGPHRLEIYVDQQPAADFEINVMPPPSKAGRAHA